MAKYLQFGSTSTSINNVSQNIVNSAKNAWDVIIAGNIYSIIAAVALIFIGVAAYKYITSNGEADKMKIAKQGVINVIIGIVIVIGAFGMINAIIAISNTGEDVVGERIDISDEPSPNTTDSDDPLPTYSVIETDTPADQLLGARAFDAGVSYIANNPSIIDAAPAESVSVPEEYQSVASDYKQGALCQAQVNSCKKMGAVSGGGTHSCDEILQYWGEVHAENGYCTTWKINTVQGLTHQPVGRATAYNKGGAIHFYSLSIANIKTMFASSDQHCLQLGYNDAKNIADGMSPEDFARSNGSAECK